MRTAASTIPPVHCAIILAIHLSIVAHGQVLPTATPEFKRGEELSRKYCAACHRWPSPDILDVATWKHGTMPLMRTRLGIDNLDASDPGQKQVLEEWNLIWNYYQTAAPEKALPQSARPAIRMGLKQFTLLRPSYQPAKRYLSLVQIDSKSRRIFVGNAETKSLDVLDSAGKQLSSLSLESPPVSLAHGQEGWYCTLIGRIPPHNQKLGKVVLLDYKDDAFTLRAEVLRDLPRPTDGIPVDLNNDGREDLVVSGFGNLNGSFGWWENRGKNTWTEHVLIERPGAVRAQIYDFDTDQRPDIAVLMAQGKEGFWIFLNDGGGKFTELPAWEQQPAWGYAGFSLTDFDGDGAMDVLTANGDNGEYFSCLKRYHGVRLYRNHGAGGYHPVYFFPMNGAFKALAADFDQDGDNDIAAISYFPDFDGSPEESFVYLENRGALQFDAYSFPEARLGRWLVMDAADVDGDDDVDIVIGAANRTPYKTPSGLLERWEKDGPAMLILLNSLKH